MSENVDVIREGMLLDDGDAKALGSAFIIVRFNCDPHGR